MNEIKVFNFERKNLVRALSNFNAIMIRRGVIKKVDLKKTRMSTRNILSIGNLEINSEVNCQNV